MVIYVGPTLAANVGPLFRMSIGPMSGQQYRRWPSDVKATSGQLLQCQMNGRCRLRLRMLPVISDLLLDVLKTAKFLKNGFICKQSHCKKMLCIQFACKVIKT